MKQSTEERIREIAMQVSIESDHPEDFLESDADDFIKKNAGLIEDGDFDLKVCRPHFEKVLKEFQDFFQKNVLDFRDIIEADCDAINKVI